MPSGSSTHRWSISAAAGSPTTARAPRWTSPSSSPPDEPVAHIGERCAETGEAYLPEQIEAVMGCQIEYLRFIGAVGRPVDDDT